MIKIEEYFQEIPVVPIVRSANSDIALGHCRALIVGGFRLLEVAMTTPGADLVLNSLHHEYPNVLLGAGTVVTRESAEIAVKAGAEFLIAPNFSPEVAHFADDHEIPYIPGVMTPSEISTALTGGLSVLKLFPASNLGVPYLEAVQKVFPSVRFIPTGGIVPEGIQIWIKAGALALGVGGELTRGTSEDIVQRSQLLQNGWKS